LVLKDPHRLAESVLLPLKNNTKAAVYRKILTNVYHEWVMQRKFFDPDRHHLRIGVPHIRKRCRFSVWRLIQIFPIWHPFPQTIFCAIVFCFDSDRNKRCGAAVIFANPNNEELGPGNWM
jgi:hypothetical protein